LKESQETGRLYAFLADNVNSHTPFNLPIYMSNLCVTGDTQICVSYSSIGLNPMTINIKDLEGYTLDGLYVLSKNIDTNLQEWNLITNFAQTSSSAEIIKVIDDQFGITITCTPDHLIYTKRGYVEAQDLLETDELDISEYKYLQS
jgi:intein/homing endonuclease